MLFDPFRASISQYWGGGLAGLAFLSWDSGCGRELVQRMEAPSGLKRATANAGFF